MIDATEGDYVTCPRCRVMRPADVRGCPKCSLDALLTVERFLPTPNNRERAEAYAARRALERAIHR